MNSYRLISHRLYVAAIGNESLPANLPPKETGLAFPVATQSVPLELLAGKETMPVKTIRPLRIVAQNNRR